MNGACALEVAREPVVHLLGDEEVLVVVECLQQLRRDVGVALRHELHPLGERHEHLDGIHHVRLLVEFLDHSRHLGELVAESCHLLRVLALVHLAHECVDREEELVHDLRSCHGLGGTLLLPSPPWLPSWTRSHGSPLSVRLSLPVPCLPYTMYGRGPSYVLVLLLS